MQDYRAEQPPSDRDSRSLATLSMIASMDGAAAMFPGGYPLRQAMFVRCRGHLLVRVAGHADVIVPRFFDGGAMTTLATGDGQEMSRHMVLLMLNISHRVERVLNELAVPASGDL